MNIDRTKKVIYLVIGIIVLGVLGYLAYRSFVPSQSVSPATEERIRGGARGQNGREEDTSGEIIKEGVSEEIIVSPSQKLIKISDFPVISPSLGKEQNKIIYYKKEAGGLFSSNFDGSEKEKISNITIVGLMEALWSGSKDRAAVFYLDDETMKGFLHAGTSSVAALPQDIRSFSWSPDGKSFVYATKKDLGLSIITADASGRNQRTILSTPILDAHIHWATSDKVALQTAPSGLAEGFVFVYSRTSGALTKIMGPLFGLSTLWSPDGTKILVSTTNAAGQALELSVRDSKGEGLFNTTVKTIPEKCAWESLSIIWCGVPEIIFGIWPDDYLRGEINTADRLVKIDLEKRTTSEILSGQEFDISNLIFDPKGEYLFFVDRKDGSLWSLKLK